jgi:hypothetical protein
LENGSLEKGNIIPVRIPYGKGVSKGLIQDHLTPIGLAY